MSCNQLLESRFTGRKGRVRELDKVSVNDGIIHILNESTSSLGAGPSVGTVLHRFSRFC